ncbi:MAG: DUF2884 domain-containing protein [Xanthomonadaceae bacterium]|nr:DUF2884 domain-containing protein [Xanthomonadaceae bacterium]
MDKQDIKLNARGYPDARITPEGNLVIGDSVVEITGEQHGLLTQYRGQVAAIAQQGAQMGVQGAAVAAATAKAVIGAVFSGDTDQVEAKVKAETDKIKEHVGVLCGHLAELKQTQDTLAAQLPAFAPYAHIDQDDIDDCNSR